MFSQGKPALTVAAVIERDGRFLMVEELVQGQHVLNQPAGHVEAGESLPAAVIRETLEETAWHFEPQAVTGIYLWQAAAGARPFLRVVFSGRCGAHETGRKLDRGILRALWLRREDLLGQSIATLRSPMVLRSIDDYLAGHREDPAAIVALDRAQLAARATVL
jgi:8-oxo-dGTP pyrophosphatase MutT (NUDIX family)